MTKTHVFTSAAWNYLPKVRILFESIKKHHPEWETHFLVADKFNYDFDIEKEPFDNAWSIDDLDIPNYSAWIFCHNIVELATALKPFLFKKLLSQENVKKVIFLDPDIVVFSRLDEILGALNTSSIVLTPHLTSPEKFIHGIMDNEISALKHGAYNLGFLGVSNTEIGKEFIDWWAYRLYYFCKNEIHNGFFTDQKWIDLVPALFDKVLIVRSSRFNVASWNIPIRRISKNKKNQYMVDGERLGFYHFTGFDSGAHIKMLKKYKNYNHAVKELVDWYISQIKLHTKSNSQEWGFSRFSNGELISDQQRDLYSQRIDLQVEFKNPFQESGFLRWYNSQFKTPLKFFIFTLKKYALRNKNQKILRGPLYPNMQSTNYKKSE
jgi:lipopolysaccharide biosynthesis glycosyltransferase